MLKRDRLSGGVRLKETGRHGEQSQQQVSVMSSTFSCYTNTPPYLNHLQRCQGPDQESMEH